MRISSFFLVGLILTVAVFLPDTSEASSSDPVELDDWVLVESYKKVTSTHLVVTPTTKSAYQNVVIYVFTTLPVKVTVNGSEIHSFTPVSPGSKLLLNFDEGDEVELSVSLGSSLVYDYGFTVRKTISIKELDPEEKDDVEQIFSLGDVLVFCVIAGISGSFGVYGMYRFFKRRSLMEVRSLGER